MATDYAEGSNTNYRITTHNLLLNCASAQAGGYNPMAYKNNVWSGKKIGTELTDEQKTAIKAGNFKNIFLGDFWEVSYPDKNNMVVNWRVAGFNYFYAYGTLKSPHIVVIPDTCIGKTKFWNSTPSQTGLDNSTYMESLMSIKSSFVDAPFKNTFKTVRWPYSSTITNTNIYYIIHDTMCGVLSTSMMFGSNIQPYNLRDMALKNVMPQLPIFRIIGIPIINSNTRYWLSDIITSSNVMTTYQGQLMELNGTEEHGIRPWVIIG